MTVGRSTIAVLVALAAPIAGCDQDDAQSAEQDEYEAAQEAEMTATAELGDALQGLARTSGDLPCGLPHMPNERNGHRADPGSYSVMIIHPAPLVQQFYRTAAESAGRTVAVETRFGMVNLKLSAGNGDGDSAAAACHINLQPGKADDNGVETEYVVARFGTDKAG